jgi:hypothetical protein
MKQETTMGKRRFGVLVLVLLVLALAVPAGATEAGAEAPAYEDICNEANPVVLEHCPPSYEEPSVFPPILYTLLIIAAVIAVALLVLFLLWQPRFAQERDRVKGRR